MQLGQLTSDQAASLYSIKPSTWRAYVARKQAPQSNPDGTWDIINLLLWRNIPVSRELKTAALCQMFRITAYGMAWHNRTRALLEQAGLGSSQAILFADSTTPKGMTVNQFKQLTPILDYRRDFQRKVRFIAPIVDSLTRDDLYYVVSRRAGSVHPVLLFDELGLLCIARGMDEVSPPWGQDPDFFTDSPKRFMRLLEKGQFLSTVNLEIEEAA